VGPLSSMYDPFLFLHPWKIVTQPDIDAVFENTYYIQITETGFAEKF
jgi:hypothetical protein